MNHQSTLTGPQIYIKKIPSKALNMIFEDPIFYKIPISFATGVDVDVDVDVNVDVEVDVNVDIRGCASCGAGAGAGAGPDDGWLFQDRSHRVTRLCGFGRERVSTMYYGQNDR